jgi:hypothetical protein
MLVHDKRPIIPAEDGYCDRIEPGLVSELKRKAKGLRED